MSSTTENVLKEKKFKTIHIYMKGIKEVTLEEATEMDWKKIVQRIKDDKGYFDLNGDTRQFYPISSIKSIDWK
jgi:hypothetical protein